MKYLNLFFFFFLFFSFQIKGSVFVGPTYLKGGGHLSFSNEEVYLINPNDNFGSGQIRMDLGKFNGISISGNGVRDVLSSKNLRLGITAADAFLSVHFKKRNFYSFFPGLYIGPSYLTSDFGVALLGKVGGAIGNRLGSFRKGYNAPRAYSYWGISLFTHWKKQVFEFHFYKFNKYLRHEGKGVFTFSPKFKIIAQYSIKRLWDNYEEKSFIISFLDPVGLLD